MTLEQFLQRMIYKGQPRRPLVEPDIEDWFDAADEMLATLPKKVTLDQIKLHMKRQNPLRWRRINSDYKWLERETQKLGLDKETARYLL